MAPETMAPQTNDASWRRTSPYKVVLFAVLVIGAARLTPRLLPILLSIFLAIVFGLVIDAPVSALAQRGVRRGIGTTFVAVAAGGALIGAGLLLGPTVVHEFVGLSSQHHSLSAALAGRINEVTAHLPVKVPRLHSSELAGKRLFSAVGGAGAIASAGAAIGLGVVAFLAAAWAVASPEPLAGRLLSLVPPTRRTIVAHVSGAVLDRLRRWLVGQLVLNVIVGVSTYVVLVLVGVPFAALFAVVAGALGMIPTFGVLIASAGPVLLTLLYHPDRLLWLLIGIGVLHALEDRFLVPVVMQRSVDLHPSLLSFILVVASVVLGPLGLLLAVPLSAALFTIHDELVAERERYLEPSGAGEDGAGPLPRPGSGPVTRRRPRHLGRGRLAGSTGAGSSAVGAGGGEGLSQAGTVGSAGSERDAGAGVVDGRGDASERG